MLHTGGQAVVGVVGEGECLGFVDEGLDGEHRAEHLLAHDGGRVGDVGDHGGSHEAAAQRRVDDAFRGRVHTLDFLAMTSAFLFWGFVAGGLYDATGSLAWAFLVPTCAAALAGPLWWLLAGRRLGQPDPSGGPSAPTPAR